MAKKRSRKRRNSAKEKMENRTKEHNSATSSKVERTPSNQEMAEGKKTKKAKLVDPDHQKRLAAAGKQKEILKDEGRLKDPKSSDVRDNLGCVKNLMEKQDQIMENMNKYGLTQKCLGNAYGKAIKSDFPTEEKIEIIEVSDEENEEASGTKNIAGSIAVTRKFFSNLPPRLLSRISLDMADPVPPSAGSKVIPEMAGQVTADVKSQSGSSAPVEKSEVKMHKYDTEDANVMATKSNSEIEKATQYVMKDGARADQPKPTAQEKNETTATSSNVVEQGPIEVSLPLLTASPQQKTSWKTCCGMFDLFLGSRNNNTGE